MSALPAKPPRFDRLDPLLAPLAAVRRRARFYLALEGLVRLVLAMIAAGLVQLLLDRWLRFTVDQRAAVNSVITLLWLWVAYRFGVRPLMRPMGDVEIAAAVDRANPQLHNQLATAVQFAAGRVGDAASNSPQLVEAVVRDACRRAADIPFLQVLDHQRARRRALELGGLLLLIALAFGISFEMMSIWFRRNWLLADVAWPQRTRIVPVGYESSDRRRFPLNDELVIVADVIGEPPTAATLHWRTLSGQRGRETMTRLGDRRLTASLGVMTETVLFRILGGDEPTREYVAEGGERPHVVRTRTAITPPAYAGLETMSIEQETVFEVLAGSRVTIEAWLNKPVSQAQFQVGDARPVDCERVSPTQIRVSFRAVATAAGGADPASAPVDDLPALTSGSGRFELLDAEGWNDRRPVRFTIKVAPDGPPSARMDLIGVGEVVTPEAEIRMRLRFDDPYGLQSAALAADRNGGEPQLIPITGFEPGQRQVDAEAAFEISTLSANPGDRVRLWAEAGDAAPGGANIGRCPAVEFRVLSREDFLTEMAQRELELRREFERLISEQRLLRDALGRLAAVTEGAPPAGLPQRLAGLSRQQSTHARRCQGLALQFERVLAEMRTSRVARSVDERRLLDRVAVPLTDLSVGPMAEAAAAILAARAGVDETGRTGLMAAQDRILESMRAILAQMLEWEGYQETVTLLREIIDEQSQVQGETQSAVADRLQAILGLDQPPGAPATQPTP